jgi:lysophospholipase L1-like esterase
MPQTAPTLPITRGARALLLAALMIVACGAHALGAEAKGPRPTIPEEKDRPRHDEFLTVAKAGNVDLLFLGDSITDGWRGGGLQVWNKYFAPLKAANFGIGGDRTEHVIWRLRHGELEGIQPKLVVLMIGTNNGDPAEDVAAGIKTIIADIHERSPGSRILLLGIFPRGEKPAGRERNEAVNKLIAALPDRKVTYLDIGQVFLTADGTLSKDIMPDFLHPNERGYQLWADAIIAPVKQMLQSDPTNLAPHFAAPATVAKVAKQEELAASGKVGAAAKALEHLAEDTYDKSGKTADEAKAGLAVITAWKEGVDGEIAAARQAGDVTAAYDLAAAMAATYTGDLAKGYQAQVAELKKDPSYAAGREFEKLRAVPYGDRRDARFAKLVEAFVKKHPGYYADQAQALVPKD